MVIENIFLRSKVGRRIFFYFALSALLPIAFLAALYFGEVTSLLREQAHAQLDTAAKSYRTSLYERLLLVDELLHSSASELIAANVLETKKPRAQAFKRMGVMSPAGRAFQSLFLELPSGGSMSVIGDGVAIFPLTQVGLAHLKRGEPLLQSQAVPGGVRILVSQALDPQAPERGVVTAEVNQEFLWGSQEDVPYRTYFCVLGSGYQPLFCPEPQQPRLIEKRIAGSTSLSRGQINWRNNGNNYLASFNELFLQAKFSEARWLVIASQSEDVALRPVKTFNELFWSTIALSLLIALLLSATQIRQILLPLVRLTEGARRIGSKDFLSRIEVTTEDEFGELGKSFNAMSTELGEQFGRQTALSAIDQAILSEQEIGDIVARVLEYLRSTFAAHYVCVIDLEMIASDISTVYWVDDYGRKPLVKGTPPGEAIRARLLAAPDGFWADDDLRQQVVRARRLDIGIAHEFWLPIIWKNELTGMLALGYKTRPVLDPLRVRQIREFSDRLGVALSADAREKQLYRQAKFDPVTDLPNRFLFIDRMQQEIAQAQRGKQVLVVLFIDLDRFKMINDTLGHAAGDELLRQAGARLRDCVREGDTVARFGGDEFAILLNSPTLPHGVAVVADHVIAAMSRPFRLKEDEHFVTASVGIATYPADGLTPEDLLRGADMAMYRAKGRGGGTYSFFEEVMNATMTRRADLEREIRSAITAENFKTHYQPLIDARSGRVYGVEALVRWEHPKKGMIPPLDFIQIAEDTGLIVQIGQIVLAQSCAQFRAWLDEGIHLERVCVNLSPRQLRQENLVDLIETELMKNALPGSCLELEITEGILVDKNEVVLKMFERMRALGIRLAIDDFGTGYSSLAYLDRLPFDTLKIDKQFIDRIDNEGKGGTIAQTILVMAKAMHKCVVAEGVETEAQANCLRDLDCDLLQGYFFSRPLPAEKIAAFVREADRRRKDASVT